MYNRGREKVKYHTRKDKDMKFRKKPVIVEAEQFFSDKQPHPDGVEPMENSVTRYTIKTLEGLMCVNEGDWIITGIEGEKYPCKPDIFDATYEKVS